MPAELDYVFGFYSGINHGFAFHGNTTVLFLAGKLCVFQNLEDGTQKFLHLPELSFPTAIIEGPKNFLVVADKNDERARVILYDVESAIKKTLPDPKTAEIEEFICLSFSTDYKFLAGQGGPPNFPLVVWVWEKKVVKTVYAPSLNEGSNILQICFHPRDNEQIVAVGKHYFRLYKFEAKSFKPYIFSKYESEGSYLGIAWLPKERLAISTNDGRILMFDGIEQRYEIVVRDESQSKTKSEFEIHPERNKPREDEVKSVSCLYANSHGLLCVYGSSMVIEYGHLEDGKSYKFKQAIHLPIHEATVQNDLGEVEISRDRITHMSLNSLEEILVVCTDNGQIFQYSMIEDIVKTFPKYFHCETQRTHRDSIIALDIAVSKPIIVSCSKNMLILWNFDKKLQIMRKQFCDSILCAAIHPFGLHLVIGFLEYVRIFAILTDGLSEMTLFSTKNCTQASFCNNGHLLAIANETHIEIYNFLTLKNIIVFKGHKGLLTSFVWNSKDSILISSDTKGAIYIWDIMKKERIVENVVKTTSYSSIAISGDGNIYAVGTDSTIRQMKDSDILKDVPTKPEMTSLALSCSDHYLFGGTVTGCIRSFHFPLTADASGFDKYAHLGKITKVKIAFGDKYVITVGVDGMLSMWKIIDRAKDQTLEVKFSNAVLIDENILMNHFEFKKRLEGLLEHIELDNDYQMALQKMRYDEQQLALRTKVQKKIDELNIDIAKLSEEKRLNLATNEETMIRIEAKHQKQIEELVDSNWKKLLLEYERHDDLLKRSEETESSLNEKLMKLEEDGSQQISELTSTCKNRLEEKDEIIQNEIILRKQEEEQHEILLKSIEEGNENEILGMKNKFSRDLQSRENEIHKLKEANEVAKQQVSHLKKDIFSLKDQMKKASEKAKILKTTVNDYETSADVMEKMIKDKNSIIKELNERIFNLNQEKQDLQKQEYVLNYSYVALQKEIEPKDAKIKAYHFEIQKLTQDLEHERNVLQTQTLEFEALSNRLKSTEKELKRERQKIFQLETTLERFRADFSACRSIVQAPKKLKEAVKKLLEKHVATAKKTAISSDCDSNEEFSHQRDHLEKTINVLRKRLHKENENHRIEYIRMVQENSDLIKSLNELRQDLKMSHQRTRAIEMSLGLNSQEFSLEGTVMRQKLEAVVNSLNKNDDTIKAKLAEKDNIIEMQQEELRRLQALFVVDEEGRIVKE